MELVLIAVDVVPSGRQSYCEEWKSGARQEQKQADRFYPVRVLRTLPSEHEDDHQRHTAEVSFRNLQPAMPCVVH
jgi:hypothetical protein